MNNLISCFIQNNLPDIYVNNKKTIKKPKTLYKTKTYLFNLIILRYQMDFK